MFLSTYRDLPGSTLNFSASWTTILSLSRAWQRTQFLSYMYFLVLEIRECAFRYINSDNRRSMDELYNLSTVVRGGQTTRASHYGDKTGFSFSSDVSVLFIISWTSLRSCSSSSVDLKIVDNSKRWLYADLNSSERGNPISCMNRRIFRAFCDMQIEFI